MALSSQAKKALIDTLREEFTEERSDVVKKVIRRKIKKRLPSWLSWLPIGRILDELLPEVLIDSIEDVL